MELIPGESEPDIEQHPLVDQRFNDVRQVRSSLSRRVGAMCIGLSVLAVGAYHFTRGSPAQATNDESVELAASICGALTEVGGITESVTDFNSMEAMQQNGWSFRADGECENGGYHFKHPLHGKDSPLGHQIFIPKSSYHGWCWPGSEVMSLTLKGSGSLKLIARNANAGLPNKPTEGGDVIVEVGAKSERILPGGKSDATWKFNEGDVLTLKEDGDGIIVIDYLVFDCEKIPSPKKRSVAPPSLYCRDVPPPNHYHHNTCESQLKDTDNCALRRDGTLNDGYCSITCGLCVLQKGDADASLPGPPVVVAPFKSHLPVQGQQKETDEEKDKTREKEEQEKEEEDEKEEDKQEKENKEEEEEKEREKEIEKFENMEEREKEKEEKKHEKERDQGQQKETDEEKDKEREKKEQEKRRGKRRNKKRRKRTRRRKTNRRKKTRRRKKKRREKRKSRSSKIWRNERKRRKRRNTKRNEIKDSKRRQTRKRIKSGKRRNKKKRKRTRRRKTNRKTKKRTWKKKRR
eukprot:TRINITY_DN1144_c0_g1_i5.p1 TRINITY_DN1144_c0_g1~~TRINITY_DN1144_c0_g1_i5.p1  ORF type:complete len:519 (-),score=81.18 TRINITY_DN1144_c0_g1_i5:1191-2747(-)